MQRDEPWRVQSQALWLWTGFVTKDIVKVWQAVSDRAGGGGPKDGSTCRHVSGLQQLDGWRALFALGTPRACTLRNVMRAKACLVTACEEHLHCLHRRLFQVGHHLGMCAGCPRTSPHGLHSKRTICEAHPGAVSQSPIPPK